MNRKLLLVAALTGLSLLVAACGGDADTEPGGTPTVTPAGTDTGAGPTPSAVFSSGSETVSIGGGIPDGFPDSFPLPDDVTVAYSASSADTFLVWFGTGTSFADLKSHFDDELPANGWTIDTSLDFDDSNGAYRAYSISGNGYSGGLFVGEGAPGSESFEGDFAFFVSLSPA